MNSIQHIALFGASGRTGQEIMIQALEKGLRVTALVRKPASIQIKHANLKLIEGTPMSQEDVKRTITGTDAVIVALNICRTSDFPWAKVITPTNLFEKSMSFITISMQAADISRIVTISAWGVHNSHKDADPVLKFLIKRSKIGVTFQGHEDQERILRASGLNWTAVRPVNLKNNKTFKPLIERLNNSEKLKMTVGRKDVAKYILDILDNKSYVFQTPAISNS